MVTADFVHLHLHTQYSLLDGQIRIPDLITRVKQYKMPAIAVTDHGNLFGAMEFYSKVTAAGIKPIIGCEVYVAPGSRFDQTAKVGEPTAHHLVLLCENEKGYRNLCKLTTKAYMEGFYYKPRVDKELLAELHEGLIALSACLSGEPASHLLLENEKAALAAAAWYKDVFTPERYYLELQENGLPEQARVNAGILDISKKLDLKVVATNDCHYLDRSDHKSHEVLLCIQTGKKLSDEKRMSFDSDQFFLKSPELMAHEFRHTPHALKTTREIAEKCSLVLEMGHTHMPRFNLGTGETLRDRFKKDAFIGFDHRFAQAISSGQLDEKAYRDRLDTEIKLIQNMGFSGYFLIVADFINYARKSGIPVGPGRGSAAGSLAAYCLGITDLDPIRYNLLFERFLNPERKSMPDIDVDFCMTGRDQVIDYVSQRYGKDRVAQITTFGRMQAKAVVRDTARVMGLPYADADKLAKLIPDDLKSIDDAAKKDPKLRELIDRADIAELIETAKSLEGLVRHVSTHAAGIVISDRPLVEHLPLYVGPNKETITQFDMGWVEKIGLVKFDFLGLKTLTVIDNALKLIERTRKEKLDLTALPEADADTFAMLCKGDTTGVFQLESSGMRDMLTKFKPSVFEDLIAILALYRPGPLESGMVDDFINRKHGRIPIEYILPQLESILKETYGVMVYQEQVMSIAVKLAHYTLGEADLLRRAMGKKKPEEMAAQKTRFEKGAVKNGISPEKASFIFDLMEKFSGYGFNKSHSAAYALVSYQTAYLKAHYAPEFMAAQLSCEAGNTAKITSYITECRSMGIEVLPPHVNASHADFTVRDGKIIFGLGAIKNVGEGAIHSIIEARESGEFCNLQDFTHRVDLRKVNKKVMESLIKCGAFDGLRSTRRSMFEALDSVLERAQSFQRERNEGQFNLFATSCEPGEAGDMNEIPVPPTPEWEESFKLRNEKELLGFYVTGHPLMKHYEIIEKYCTANSSNLGAKSPGAVVRFAGMTKNVKEHTTKKGERMAFIEIEDLDGAVEATVFADLYVIHKELLQSGDPIVLIGTREGEGETPKLLAQDIVRIEETPRKFGRNVTIRFSTPGVDAEKIKALRKILIRHRGQIPVRVHVVIPNRTETIIGLDAFGCDPTQGFVADVHNTFGPDAIEIK